MNKATTITFPLDGYYEINTKKHLIKYFKKNEQHKIEDLEILSSKPVYSINFIGNEKKRTNK